MQTFFSPAVSLMNRFKYPAKFSFIALFALLAIASLLWSLTTNLLDTVRLSHNEQAALQLIRPVHKQIQLTQQHRGLSAGFLGGNQAMKEKMDAKQGEVVAAIKTADEIEAAHRALLRSGEEWAALKGEWEALRGGLPTMKVADTLKAHGQLIERLLRFQSQLADAGALNGDPDIDSFYLIDTVVNKLPEMLERLGKMRAKGTGVLARKEMSEADRTEFAVHVVVLQRTLDALKLNLTKAGRQNPAIAGKLDQFSAALEKAAGQVVGMVNGDILGGTFAIAPQAYFDQCTQTIDIGYQALFDTLLPTLDSLIQARIERLQRQLTLQVGVAALCIALLFYFGVGVYLVVIRAVNGLSTGATAMAQGDLTVRIHLDSEDELSQVANSFNSMATAFNNLLRTVQQSANHLSGAAGELATSSARVSASSQQQSASASGMASAIEQMTASINQIAEHAQSAQQISSESGRLSAEGGHIVENTVREMEQIAASVNQSATIIEELGRHSENISAIVNVIKEIADQTNLLALNAAIEAARAGEQGRGFAVVADEVRKLAERTTQSTQEIGTMIAAIQNATGNAVSSMNSGVERVSSGVALSQQAGASIGQVQAGADRVVDVVNEISLAMNEQSKASSDIARNIEHIAEMAEQNNEDVNATARTAQSLEQLAGQLQAEVRRFRVG
jgi:methyl-accepting chemotaxis protein